jgi:hypothetical protein
MIPPVRGDGVPEDLVIHHFANGSHNVTISGPGSNS